MSIVTIKAIAERSGYNDSPVTQYLIALQGSYVGAGSLGGNVLPIIRTLVAPTLGGLQGEGTPPPVGGAATPAHYYPFDTATVLEDTQGNYDATWTRGTTGHHIDPDGTVWETKENEIDHAGCRRVETLMNTDSTDFSESNRNTGWEYNQVDTVTHVSNAETDPQGNASSADTLEVTTGASGGAIWLHKAIASVANTEASDIIVSIYLKGLNGTTDWCLTVYDGTRHVQTITISSEWERYSFLVGNLATGNDVLVYAMDARNGNMNSGTYKVATWGYQVENVSGKVNQNPSEYVHSTNVDPISGVAGVSYFNTENGNTVTDNVVTEATGAAYADSALHGIADYLAQTNDLAAGDENCINWSNKPNTTYADVGYWGDLPVVSQKSDGTSGYHNCFNGTGIAITTNDVLVAGFLAIRPDVLGETNGVPQHFAMSNNAGEYYTQTTVTWGSPDTVSITDGTIVRNDLLADGVRWIVVKATVTTAGTLQTIARLDQPDQPLGSCVLWGPIAVALNPTLEDFTQFPPGNTTLAASAFTTNVLAAPDYSASGSITFTVTALSADGLDKSVLDGINSDAKGPIIDSSRIVKFTDDSASVALTNALTVGTQRKVAIKWEVGGKVTIWDDSEKVVSTPDYDPITDTAGSALEFLSICGAIKDVKIYASDDLPEDSELEEYTGYTAP